MVSRLVISFQAFYSELVVLNLQLPRPKLYVNLQMFLTNQSIHKQKFRRKFHWTLVLEIVVHNKTFYVVLKSL